MEKNDIKFKYLFEEDYDPCYVNGVYGGINPSGEIVMNFYLERIPLPYEAAVSTNEDGEPCGDVKIVSPEEYKFIRSIKNGIIVDKDTAQEIQAWLQAMISEMEEMENE